MDCLEILRLRVQDVADLPSLLDAAYDAFTTLIPVIEDQQDPASPWFVPFVMAAASAASGRFAVIEAPSFPGIALTRPVPRPGPRPADQAAVQVIALAQALASQLDEASLLARAAADRQACARATRHAQDLCTRLGGEPPA
jgi:hypothetical protein